MNAGAAIASPAARNLANPERRGRWAALGHEWRIASLTVKFSALLLLLFYLFAAASPIIAPYDPAHQWRELPDCPPMRLHLAPRADWNQGFLYAWPMRLDLPLARHYAEDHSHRTFVRLFHRGHLFTTAPNAPPFFLIGSEGLGRDLFSRIVYGARVSMCIGLVGVAISFSLGIMVGAFSGLMGGMTDSAIMRLCEVEMSLPRFYFLLALAAVIPSGLSTTATFFLIVGIMAFISWAGFARVIRGMAASVRSAPFVEAARALGGSRARLLFRHVIPSVIGFAAVNASLSIPGYILGESALSLLGLGIQEPAASWGNLLSQAMDPQTVAYYPWVLAPGLFISAAVMAFNFLGDHLRDRFDPSNSG